MEMDLREQQRADRELEERAKAVARGQHYALTALVIVTAAVVVLGLEGHDWLAGTFGGATIVSLIGLFLTGRWEHRDDTKPAAKAPAGETRRAPLQAGSPDEA
jgi:hypothetical protein